MAEWTFYVRVVAEQAVDSGDHLTYELHGVAAQADPVPIVYVDGVAQGSGYTFDYGDAVTVASITFSVSKEGSEITCSYRWKYACGDEEDAGVWAVDREMNQVVGKDANGRAMIAISYTPVSNFRGIVTWEYMPKTFWQEWQTIVENGYTFDIERTSDGDEPRTLENLLPLTYPKWEEIPGMPDMINVGVEFMQI